MQWWQGENNAFQCHDANSKVQAGKDHGQKLGGGPNACGAVADHTGYACKMENLVNTWREIWAASSATAADFPFGIVSLAGGTSEGEDLSIRSVFSASAL